MSTHTHDDNFHEVHLNGKQLVFLFMAATAVSVVLFLCGVLVGRGVRAARELQAGQVVTGENVAAAETAVRSIGSTALVVDEGDDPRVAAPPRTVSEPGEPIPAEPPTQAREEPKPGAETPTPAPAPAVRPAPAPAAQSAPAPAPAQAARPPAVQPAPAPAAQPVPAPATRPAPAAAAPVRAASNTEPSSPADRELPRAAAAPRPGDWVVQVAALNVRSEADEIAKRLTSKGYATYVVSPPNGNQKVFRVRIGPFPSRREADTMAAKLQREEKFKPWVTR